MHLSSRVEYGLMAMAALARPDATAIPLRTKDIANRERLSFGYLSQVMAALHRANLVEAVRGPNGGYRLARPPVEITLIDIVEALEGSWSEAAAASNGPNGTHRALGSDRVAARIAEAWDRAGAAARAVLSQTSLSQLCPETAVPMYHI